MVSLLLSIHPHLYPNDTLLRFNRLLQDQLVVSIKNRFPGRAKRVILFFYEILSGSSELGFVPG